MITSSHDWSLEKELSIWKTKDRIDVSRLLFWDWYEPRNFGDWIGPYLYEAKAGRRPYFCPQKHMGLLGCTMSAGSILRHIIHDDSAVVWGSGIISAQDSFRHPKRVIAVRGPLTRNRFHELGYECPEIYGDPAMLLPRFYMKKNLSTSHAIGLIPHFIDRHLFRSDSEDLLIIDPTRPVEVVVDAISSCRLTFSSSLHGVIVSHAYGVPSVWIRSINPLIGDDTKFRDYFLSVGIDPNPVTPAEYDIRSLAALEGHAELPRHEPLLDSLLETCPFDGSPELRPLPRSFRWLRKLR